MRRTPDSRPPTRPLRRPSRWVGAISLGLVLSACAQLTGDEVPGVRDPLLWPYPAESIWNYPRGDDADLVPFPVSADDLTVMAEEDLIIAAPEAETQDVLRTTAGWVRDRTRCGEATDEVLVEDLPIPEGWLTDPDYTGRTPNHAAAVVLPDYTLLETQPLHVCEDGRIVSQYASEVWRGSSILTGGLPEEPGYGSHGGSGMTAFGGTIRVGEWVPGGTIRHALKITVADTMLSVLSGGYRWPARTADEDYAYAYVGSLEAGRMGSLVTLSPDFGVDDLESEPAKIIARALISYGAYIVDDAAQSTVGIAVEWGPNGRVKDDFEDDFGFEMVGRAQYAVDDQGDYLQDMEKIYAAFMIVDDNSESNVGGAGDRLAPLAPPLIDVENDVAKAATP